MIPFTDILIFTMVCSFDFLSAPIIQNGQVLGIGILSNKTFRRTTCDGREWGNVLEVSVYKLIYDNGNYSFSMARECEKDSDIRIKSYFVVNDTHEIIYTTKFCKDFCYVRLALDTILLWADNKHCLYNDAGIVEGKNSTGLAIINNKLTDSSFVGCIDEYALFKEGNKYHLYFAQLGVYTGFIEDELEKNGDEIWEIGAHFFQHIQDFEADFMCLWNGVNPIDEQSYVYAITASKGYRALFVHKINYANNPYEPNEKSIIEFPYYDMICENNHIQLYTEDNTLTIYHPWHKDIGAELITVLFFDENGELRYGCR